MPTLEFLCLLVVGGGVLILKNSAQLQNKVQIKVFTSYGTIAFIIFWGKPLVTLIDLFLVEMEPSTRQVRIGGTLGIQKKLYVFFPGPSLPLIGNQAMHECKKMWITKLFISTAKGLGQDKTKRSQN